MNSSVPEALLATLSKINLPLGNGRFAAPVTASGSVIHISAGHTDLFPFSAASDATGCDKSANYACSMADIDIDFHDTLFAGDTEQFLNYYEGVCGYRNKGIDIELTADMERDLFVIRIKDDRPVPAKPITLTVGTLRPNTVEAGSHTAVSQIKKKTA